MTTVGTALGVTLNTNTNPASGDICNFFCNDVKVKLLIKDKPSHYANELSNMVNLSQQYYEATISNAIVTTNSITLMNSYHALMKVWSKAATSVYLHLKDNGGVYFDFITGTTNTDYLTCRLVGDITFGLSNGKKTISFKVEGCS